MEEESVTQVSLGIGDWRENKNIKCAKSRNFPLLLLTLLQEWRKKGNKKI
jgi:hypothetical protein